MTSPQVLEDRTGPGQPGLTDRLSRHPVVAGLTSGLLLWSAFPPVEWSWLAWVALVPLFWLVIQPGPRLRLYLGAWAGGLVFWLLSRPVGPAHRPDGLAGLAGHGRSSSRSGGPASSLLARARGVPAEDPAHDGGADPLGRPGVRPGPSPDRLPLVLPRPQPVPLPHLDPGRRHHQRAGDQLPDRPGQRLVVDLLSLPCCGHRREALA